MYTFNAIGAFMISEPSDSYIYDIVPVGDNIASISSDNVLRFLDPNYLHGEPLVAIPRIHADVTCLKVLDAQPSIVTTAGRDGHINIIDLRSSEVVTRFENYQSASIISLATCATEYAVAAGTELTNSQATILIWDIRTLKSPKIQYVESHSDDVTELQYHPTYPSILLSGSTDGLVNLYNTLIPEEDEALYQTINHGSSIHRAGFLTDLNIFALSHDEKLSVYEMLMNVEETTDDSPPVQFGDVREKLGCQYVANIMSRPGGGVIGMGNHSQDKFDLVQLRDEHPWTFVPESRVTLFGAHGSEVVRSFCFLDKHQTVCSAGEDSQIKAWRIE